MKILDVKQGSPEWINARLGIPTASVFDQIMQPKKRQASASQDKLLARLIAETALGKPIDPEASGFMERGTELEADAVRWYEFDRNVDTVEVGFCLRDDGMVGCSPDRLVEGSIEEIGFIADAEMPAPRHGGLEVKCYAAEHHMYHVLRGGMEAAAEHVCQIQGCMWITNRAWWDLLLYHPTFPKVVYRVERDDVFIADLELHVNRFVERLQVEGRKMLETMEVSQ